MKITIFVAAALLLAPCMNVWANGDEAGYNQRAAQSDMSVFRELDRAGNSWLHVWPRIVPRNPGHSQPPAGIMAGASVLVNCPYKPHVTPEPISIIGA